MLSSLQVFSCNEESLEKLEFVFPAKLTVSRRDWNLLFDMIRGKRIKLSDICIDGPGVRNGEFA